MGCVQVPVCVVCLRPEDTWPMVNRGELWCSDDCRKVVQSEASDAYLAEHGFDDEDKLLAVFSRVRDRRAAQGVVVGGPTLPYRPSRRVMGGVTYEYDSDEDQWYPVEERFL